MATNHQPAAVPLHLDHSAPNHRCQECRLNEQIRGLRDSINLQNHEKARLESENRRLSFALQVERCRRLTLLIDQAIASGDQETWARCVAERMSLGVAVEMASMGTAIDDVFSQTRKEVGGVSFYNPDNETAIEALTAEATRPVHYRRLLTMEVYVFAEPIRVTVEMQEGPVSYAEIDPIGRKPFERCWVSNADKTVRWEISERTDDGGDWHRADVAHISHDSTTREAMARAARAGLVAAGRS